MRWCVKRCARAVACLLRPSHLETVCGQFEDGIDLHGDCLVFSLLEGIVREVVGVEVLVEVFVGRTFRMRQHVVEHVLLGAGVAAHRARIPDEARDLVALHAINERRIRARNQRLRNGEPIAELVDLDHVRDEPAAGALPNNSSGENQAQQQQSARGDLPIALAENEIGVAFVPFARAST